MNYEFILLLTAQYLIGDSYIIRLFLLAERYWIKGYGAGGRVFFWSGKY